MSYISPKEKFLARYDSYNHVDRMIGSSDEIDREIANHVNLHPDHEKMLANSDDIYVQEGLATNTSNPELLDKYSNSEHKFVRPGILYNPNAQSHHLESVLNHFDMKPHYFSAASMHPNMSKELLTKMTNRDFNPSTHGRENARWRLEKKDYKE